MRRASLSVFMKRDIVNLNIWSWYKHDAFFVGHEYLKD